MYCDVVNVACNVYHVTLATSVRIRERADNKQVGEMLHCMLCCMLRCKQFERDLK